MSCCYDYKLELIALHQVYFSMSFYSLGSCRTKQQEKDLSLKAGQQAELLDCRLVATLFVIIQESIKDILYLHTPLFSNR